MNGDGDEILVTAEGPLKKKLLGIKEYGLRYKLHNELHVGACQQISAPTQISHLVVVCGNDQAEHERKLIAQLCERYGVTPPTLHANYFSSVLGVFRLNWERHTEYSTYTFFHTGPFETPFAEPAIRHVPEEWIKQLPGEVIVATHIALESKERPQRTLEELGALFASNTVIGSEVAAGNAVVWTDNQIHVDGFGRILIHDVNLRSRQAGRLVHRLLEIETYRMLAMMPVPLVRSYIPQLARFDERLAELTSTSGEHSGNDQALLDELTKLASEIEAILARTSHRINSSTIYYDIVKLRISELRERRIPGLQMFHEFVEQRLSPAMGTCALVNNKLQTLSTRVERASALLRTRVEISMEKQSRDLLRSMDRRADLQLRLQETVEGLSIVVLSYYLLGLVSYGLKGIKAAGLKFDTEVATGIAIPIVVAAVYFSVQRMKKAVHKQGQ